MMNLNRFLHGTRIAALVGAALIVAACAQNPTDPNAAAGSAAVPGSAQDFVVNVGDRVFFETDSPELTDQARATLDKQAQWLNLHNRYSFTLEGHADERRDPHTAHEPIQVHHVRRLLPLRSGLSPRLCSPSAKRIFRQP